MSLKYSGKPGGNKVGDGKMTGKMGKGKMGGGPKSKKAV
jgi:hypothetical protein